MTLLTMEMHAVDNGDGSELDLADVADGDEANEELEDSRQDHGQRLRGRRHHLLFRCTRTDYKHTAS